MKFTKEEIDLIENDLYEEAKDQSKGKNPKAFFDLADGILAKLGRKDLYTTYKERMEEWREWFKPKKAS